MSVELMKTIKEKVAALAEELKAAIKPAIKEQVDAVFAASPDVEVVGWTQYAPYFNDGEPCVFSVGEPGVHLISDDEDARSDNRGFYETTAWNFRESNPTLAAALKNLTELICAREIRDAMSQAFGSDAVVTIGRDGNVTVDEYDHD
jgi:hypothetical protein